MVNINMTGAQGNGIHNLFARLMEGYLPIPDYEGPTHSKLVLNLPGKVLDKNYSFLLISN